MIDTLTAAADRVVSMGTRLCAFGASLDRY
jgi:hypothetical protein